MKRIILESSCQVLWLRLVADLKANGRSVAETWDPPMTASGRQIALARELEHRVRAFWHAYGGLDSLGSRQPAFLESLGRLFESDEAFDYLPAEGCEEVVRLRDLMARVQEAANE